VLESTRAGWSEVLQVFQTQARTADLRPHRGRFNRTERRRADLHPHRCLLTDVVPEALSEEPGLHPSLGSSPGVAAKFVYHFIKGRGFQNLSFAIVQIILLAKRRPIICYY
jgi:hypothetical protein